MTKSAKLKSWELVVFWLDGQSSLVYNKRAMKTSTFPTTNCPLSNLARVEIVTVSTVFVLNTDQVGPNARIECIAGSTLENAQIAARALVAGGWKVRLSREQKTARKIEFAPGQDVERFYANLGAGVYDSQLAA